ncbi:MAG TPA: multicopper oxidase family protein [Allosphingosinicella sp.]|jgi:FtsP/CotA-like multicopper oxidase with cupredoxin domain
MTVERLRIRAARAALELGTAGALLALLAGTAHAEPAQESRSFENPPVLRPLEALAPAAADAQPVTDGTITYDFDIEMIPGEIYNPWTLGHDPVLLRSYRGTDFNPDVPFMAPTITMRPGQTVRVNIDNKLPATPDCDAVPSVNTPHCFNTTNLHSHGLWVSPAGNSDNVLISIPPKTAFTYEYNVPDDHPAGTFWYHPHRHGSTALQVSSGMAGALIVRGDRAPTLARPGDVDILLRSAGGGDMPERIILFQQAQYACFDQAGNVETAPGSKRWICKTGQVGEIRNYEQQFSPSSQWANSGRYTAINGRVQPLIEGLRAGTFERWRLVHAGVRESVNLRIYELRDNAPDFRKVKGDDQQKWMRANCIGAPLTSWQIAADGLTLAKALPVEESRLQPGYRADLVTWFPKAGNYCLIDGAVPNGLLNAPENVKLLGVAKVEAGAAGTDPETALRDLMIANAETAMNRPDQQAIRDRVVAGLRDDLRLDSFVWHKTVETAELTGKQNVVFDIVQDPDDQYDASTFRFEVNGQPYSPTRIDRDLPLGGVEEWTMTSNLANHPFHIHVNPFQVSSVLNAAKKDATNPADPANFDPDYANMIGQWKDTIFVKAGYTIGMRTRYQRYIGEYVLHCHILDHEDQGMMQNVRVGLATGKGGVVALGHH